MVLLHWGWKIRLMQADVRSCISWVLIVFLRLSSSYPVPQLTSAMPWEADGGISILSWWWTGRWRRGMRGQNCIAHPWLHRSLNPAPVTSDLGYYFTSHRGVLASRKLLNLAKDIDLKSQAQPKVGTWPRSIYGSLQMDLHRCSKMRMEPLGWLLDTWGNWKHLF